MYFLGGFLIPHPPVIVPEVGQGREKEAQRTRDALERLAVLTADLKPETIVLVSPHAPVFKDYVYFYEPQHQGDKLTGTLRQFGDNSVQAYHWDEELQRNILHAFSLLGIEAGALEPKAMKRFNIEPGLDHGTLVPLHFLSRHFTDFRLVVLASAGIDMQLLFEAGRAIRNVAEETRRRILLVASGDLSHKVNAESPYGACPEGGRFDAALMNLIGKSDLKGILAMDHSLREKAAECGFRSIVLLCGAMEGLSPKTEVLSYEAPFGIGYGVASFLTGVSDSSEKAATFPLSDMTSKNSHASSADIHSSADSIPAHVRIAKATIKAYIGSRHRIMPKEADAPPELLNARAGVFVSLHKFGDLRGCIGTIAPTTGSIAEEIIQNAISASTGDPRFSPVTKDELPYLTVNVDVLNPAEPISSKTELDPKLYGVIVEKGRNRGLLLPDLEGVDTVAQQLDIACRKGGIDPAGDYRISRFTITRYAE
jgi:MEMO1 family protein